VRDLNGRIVLVSRPDRAVGASNFEWRESAIPAPAAGEVLVRILYLSIDPWLRALMNHDALLPLDTVVPGDVLGRVVESRHSLFRKDDIVQGLLGWQRYVAAPWYLLRKIDPVIAPITTALGVLGSSGLTAYTGLFHVGRIQPGESVVISAAAGAVGSIAAQLAKLAGCQVTGIAGSDDKVRYLMRDLGLHAALNYKSDPEWRSRLGVHSPFGVDVYFDNVGGRVSDVVLSVLNAKARVVVCGQIASYSRPASASRLPWLLVVLEKRIRVEGFLVSDFGAQLPAALQALTSMWRAGLLQAKETIAHGLRAAPEAFISMLQGGNLGKQLVQVD
jgi:NADPH-dependent curcumin reductase CurA